MLTLEEIRVNSKESREVKRAIAVMRVGQNVDTHKIEAALPVSDSFIRFCQVLYETQGAEALLLKYKGSLPYCAKSHRKQVVRFLQSKTNETVEERRDYLEQKYHVVYQSKPSY